MFGKFASDRSGNFGIMTAILLPMLITASSLGFDFVNTVLIRDSLQSAADMAVLDAVAEQSPGVAAAMAMTGDGTITIGRSEALAIFRAQTSLSGRVDITSADISVSKAGNRLTAVLTYHATVPTVTMRMIGVNQIALNGRATAAYDMQIFRDFYLLLDNSPSMGVAATPTDVTTMVANTPDTCAFACHIDNNGVENSNDYFHLAKRLGVTTRIDVVAQATAALMDTAIKQRVTSDRYRMAIYTFGEKAEDPRLLEVSPLTVDLAQAKQRASGIQLMTIPYQGYNNDQLTDLDGALTQVQAKMGVQGSGSSPTDAEKTLFLVTDGVGDSYKPTTCTKRTTGGRCQEPIDLRFCTALKQANFKIAVLYTTYLPLPTNNWYNTWIAPFQSQIGTNLKACASDGLYFEVSPSEGIADAMKALFLQLVNVPRLTG